MADAQNKPFDAAWLRRGTNKAPLSRFITWLLPWFGLLAFGMYASFLCFKLGLNQTGLDNRFAFGLWIFLDLTIIAFGAGAFFSGFLLYVLKRHELKELINSAVVMGFICYSGAIMVLVVDVGQPIRAWFTFYHPNIHSMLAEVTVCITCYLIVLLIEYIPIILKHRKLKSVPQLLVFEHELHKLMVVFASIGTFLSFFHQGSLGGLYGVLYGRPFAFREGFAIWPSTFFLFILSAIAVGPSFLILITTFVRKMTRKKLVSNISYNFLARLSGWLLIVYVMAKSVDTLIWLNRTAPAVGFLGFDFYKQPEFGTWILFAEIAVFGLVPGIMLINAKVRQRMSLVIVAAVLACVGVAINRYVMTIQTLALPTLPFEGFASYTPSWQEVGAFLSVVAYGVILFSLSYRYLPLYPREKELG